MVMADEAVALEASDVFGLGGLWIPQSSTLSTENEYAQMIKANGDFEKWSSTFNALTNITNPYKYNADIGMGTAMPNIGAVCNGYLITEMSVESIYNDYPTVNFTGHNHGENAHIDDRTQYAVSIPLLLTGALGAYDLASLAADEVCATRSTYTISVNHLDAECDGGDHWVGQNLQGMESITVEYIGHIDTFTVDEWTVRNYTLDDSNEAFDTSSITFEKYLIRV